MQCDTKPNATSREAEQLGVSLGQSLIAHVLIKWFYIWLICSLHLVLSVTKLKNIFIIYSFEHNKTFLIDSFLKVGFRIKLNTSKILTNEGKQLI